MHFEKGAAQALSLQIQSAEHWTHWRQRVHAGSAESSRKETAMNPDQMEQRIQAREKLSYEQRQLKALEDIADALLAIRSILVTMSSEQPRRRPY